MITIVGCGPGSEDYLTAAARAAIDTADILVGAPRLLELRADSKARKIPVSARIDEVIQTIESLRAKAPAPPVTVLVSGDPGIFSLARRVIRAFGLDACRVIPGISSVQTAFARLGLAWEDARILSAHHQLPDIKEMDLASTSKLAILSGRADVLEWLQKLLQGLGEHVCVYACENLTLENETIRELTAAELLKSAPSSRCVFVITRKD